MCVTLLVSTTITQESQDLTVNLKTYAGIDTILTNRDKAYALVGTVFGCALAIYGAKHGMISVARYIEARIGKPTLVRETSRYTAKVVNVREVFSVMRANEAV